MATIDDITKRAAEIRDNYKPNSNTAELVGGVMVDLAGNLKTFEEEEAAKVEAAADAKVEERLADITNLQEDVDKSASCEDPAIEGADLYVSDEKGNVIAEFKDGHIKTKNFDSSNDATDTERGLMSASDKSKLDSIDEDDVKPNMFDDNTTSDLNIGDSQGNVIAEFKDGHIKTKNFDSSKCSENSDSICQLKMQSFRNNSDTIVEVSYVSNVPFLGIAFSLKLPQTIKARVAYGISNVLGSYTSWQENGDTISMPSSAVAMRVQFANISGNTLTSSEVDTLVNNGNIVFTYVLDDFPIVKRNQEAEKRVKAAMFDVTTASTSALLAEIDIKCHPTFVHVSDIHGDSKRLENALEFARYINADGVCATGDNVMYTYADGSKFIKDALVNYTGVPLYTCIGNHECKDAAGIKTNDDLFNEFISPYVEQGNYKSVGTTATTIPYYFADLDSQKIRLIAINQFDNVCYGSDGLGGRIGQVQASWICSTLLSTPTGYGVIILMHSPEDAITVPDALASFNQTKTYTGKGYIENGVYCSIDRPIEKIVDAFVAKTSLILTYTENTTTGNNGETVTVSADFSTLDASTEFICYMTGHRHRDRIGYNTNSSNKQVMLNVTTSNAHYARGGGNWFSNESDLPRGTFGVTQDSFNVYVIDRNNKKIIIARVGADMNMDLIERKFASIAYLD